MPRSTWIPVLILATLLASAPGKTSAAESSAPRRVPGPGLTLAPEIRQELVDQLSELTRALQHLRTTLHDQTVASPRSVRAVDLLPDVEIYHKAVAWALDYDEFYRSNEIAQASTLMRHGLERANALGRGEAPWLTATGLVVRGYLSRIDGSVQPYGLVVPVSWATNQTPARRLDVWLHGRDNQLTELKFIADHERSPGLFTPSDTLVLHPYGRYCNAFKFAGETDVFEGVTHARSFYPIDDARISIRGFSMGGAGTWHLAVHYPGLWAAAAPGAGFADTAEYTGILKKDPELPWYQRRLWHLYDAPDYALNLSQVPTVAYSGEIDPQKLAADTMARAMAAEGLSLEHLIGPDTAHKYEPKTKELLSQRFDALMAKGKPSYPSEIHFTTWTLRYSECQWLRVDGLAKHWERARVDARWNGLNKFTLSTTNVTALTLTPPSDVTTVIVILDGQTITGSEAVPNFKLRPISFHQDQGRWRSGPIKSPSRKRPGLQGPIDDAFLDAFLMVIPTGQPLNPKLAAWVNEELQEATNQWRAQFRGDVRMKADTDVTQADLDRYHLVLWGDPQSNHLLARIKDRLPIPWTDASFQIGDQTFGVDRFVPVMICPNPLQPERYIVLNSGFTFSDFGPASNALQTPKLPDWAVVDWTVSRAQRLSSGIAAAGFFDEYWRWQEASTVTKIKSD